jgi:hypothetical protein
MNIKENSIILTNEDIYTRMYQDGSYSQDLIYLYDTDPTGKTTAQMEETNQRLMWEVGMYEQDESYKRFLKNLWQIEDFVSQVLSSNKPGFVEVENAFGSRAPKKELPLGNYFKWVYDFAIRLDSGYEYSPNVDLFVNCWKKLRLNEVVFRNPKGFTPLPGKRQFELFNDFLDLIRTESRTAEFRKKISRAKEKISRRYRRAELYVDALFKNCSTRLLVLRIDLAYRHELANNITVVEAKKDLEHFLNNRRNNPTLFKGWVGYIRKLEWAPMKGFHFHLIIFFDGYARWKDGYIAEQIGEYWKKITEYRGVYWNCNDSKHEYKRCGIGMIHQADDEKRNILLNDVVDYLTKTEQKLRANVLGSDDKLFVTGVKPKPRLGKAKVDPSVKTILSRD